MSETSSDEEERRKKKKEEKKRARRAKEKEKEEDERRRRRQKPPHNPDNRMDHHQDDDLGNTSATIPPPLSDNQDSGVDDYDDDDDVGPQPMQKIGGKKIDERSYGGALLRGEGSAMAAFLQDGIESRIPRRGEIGLTSDQIAQYEDVGYVMSGSRHRRMNAVRMRKENQVISAEEKRGILKLQRDERERREAILREEFSELVNERLKGSTSASEPRPK